MGDLRWTARPEVTGFEVHTPLEGVGVLANSPEQWTLTANKAYINVVFNLFFLALQEKEAEQEVEFNFFPPYDIPHNSKPHICVKYRNIAFI